MRLKVKLTIQKEVVGHTILQQSFVAEFVVRNRQCDECAKQYTDGTWKSVAGAPARGPQADLLLSEQLLQAQRPRPGALDPELPRRHGLLLH